MESRTKKNSLNHFLLSVESIVTSLLVCTVSRVSCVNDVRLMQSFIPQRGVHPESRRLQAHLRQQGTLQHSSACTLVRPTEPPAENDRSALPAAG